MILVTGGAGVLGSRLVHGLVAKGESVRVLTLPGDPYVSRLDGLGCEIAYGDITDAASLKNVFDGINSVYHLAAIIIPPDIQTLRRINVDGTANVVNGALKSGVGHFVYVSSVSAADPGDSEYARSKIDAESVVRDQTFMQFTIVRPTLIYDSRGGQEFLMFLHSLLKFPIVPFVGRGKAKKNPVHSEDIVKGLLAIANNDRSYGKTYNFSGGEEISMWDLADLMVRTVGRKKVFIPIPIFMCRLIAACLEKIMRNPPLTQYGISRIEHEAASDNSSARTDLGYAPIGVSEGLSLCSFDLT